LSSEASSVRKVLYQVAARLHDNPSWTHHLLNSSTPISLGKFLTAYEQLAFCELFHQADTGWRDCTSCGKRLHCGCIASSAFIELLNNGGVRCVGCISNSRPDLSTSDDKLEECGVSVEIVLVKYDPLLSKFLSASDAAGRIGRLVLLKACTEAYFLPISQHEGLPLRIQDVKGKEWHVNTLGDANWHANENHKSRDMLFPPTQPSTVTIDDQEFEEYEEPPIFGKGSVFTVRLSGEQD
ncbi:B3 domain-containing transcription repressor VAL2-like protein isoform X1, partial [Tanacetum coccineum]